MNTLIDSVRDCLSRRIDRRASKHSSSEGEGRKTKSLKGSECLNKLRIDSTSVCLRRLYKECRRRRILQGVEANLRRNNVSYTRQSSGSRSSQRKRRTKVEAFGNWKFFQVSEESTQSSGGSTTVVGSAEEEDLDHWFSRVGEAQEECTEEEIVSRRISLRYPSTVGPGEGTQSLASGVSAKKK
jgi:hypothetical protein